MCDGDDFYFSRRLTKYNKVGKAVKHLLAGMECKLWELVGSSLNVLQRGAKFDHQSTC